MPHLVILYTGQLDTETDMGALCRRLADVMLAQRDEAGQPVFPPGGTRVLAYPAPHYAVGDGGVAGRAAGATLPGATADPGDYAFVYLGLRMGAGRSDATKKAAGDALLAGARAHFDALFLTRRLGVTLQIDDRPPVYDGKHGNLHPLFN